MQAVSPQTFDQSMLGLWPLTDTKIVANQGKMRVEHNRVYVQLHFRNFQAATKHCAIHQNYKFLTYKFTIMGSSRDFTVEEKCAMRRLRGEGKKLREIAEIFDCSESGVRMVLKRLRENDSAQSKKRTGRPRLSSALADRQLLRLLKKIEI